MQKNIKKKTKRTKVHIWLCDIFSRILFRVLEDCIHIRRRTHKEYGASHDISGVGGVFLYVTLKLKEKKMPTFT